MPSTQSVRFRRLLTSSASALAAMAVLIPAGGALAQESESSGGLQEIIVTAQRRQENLQQVPIAVSAVTAQSLAETGIDATRDLPQVIPSVQFTRSGPSGLFFVRGVGTTNAAAGEEGANAVYVDGVYMADLGQTINYFNNIERIEVLKGPQGTLFGRNATGGLIHVITRDPGDELAVKAEFGYANYETINARAYVAAPIAEGLSADIAVVKHHQNNGWGRNLTTGTKNKFQSYWGVRSKVVAEPSDSVKFTLSGDYLRNRDNPVGWRIADGTIGSGLNRGPDVPNTPANAIVADDHDTTANNAALTKQKIKGISLTGEFGLGFATLTSISAFRKTTTDSDFDVDGGPLPLIRIDFLSGLKSFQQELRLASDGDGPLSWQIGGFYLKTKAFNTSFFSGIAFGANRGQDVRAKLDSDSIAAFGELTYALTPTTKITGGIRYTEDSRDFDASQFIINAAGNPLPGATVTNPSLTPLPVPGVQQTKLKYNEVTWRVALRQELTPDVSVYASANRGFKSGSYSLQNPLNDPYLPQSIMAYEAGIKSELFDRRLRLNLAAFHYDVEDYQVRSAAVGNPGSSLVLNAATVEVDGVELEFEAAPVDALRLFGGVTWLNSRYKQFGGPGLAVQAPIVYPTVASGQTLANSCLAPSVGSRDPYKGPVGNWIGGYVTCLGDVSGNKVSNAPKWAASMGMTYTVPVSETGEVRFTGLWSYNDGYFFEPDNIARQGSYHLFNASVEYRPSEHWGIELWGRNLGNQDYAAQKITTGTGMAQTNAAPRTYGMNLNFRF